tara:strand:+ start:351 stop:560 length:210 start_codon:yes stop_codon:yes gene_type:complete
MKKITFLKSFKFCGSGYSTGQTSPSKRFPTIPFNDVQLDILSGMMYISIEGTDEVAIEKPVAKETKATK